MKRPVVVVGLGQLGTFFAEALLRLGHPVIPLLRRSAFQEAESVAEDPELVIVAVGEDDLRGVLEALPEKWHDRVLLLQNELRPVAWTPVSNPTVCIVWFERKQSARPTVVLPSVLSGPKSELVKTALEEMDIPSRVVPREELDAELCLKNLYVLGLNFAGLELGGAAGDLMGPHELSFRPLFEELLTIEEALFGHSFDKESAWSNLKEAILAEPAHATRGRTALRRLERTLAHAERLGLRAPLLEGLAHTHIISRRS